MTKKAQADTLTATETAKIEAVTSPTTAEKIAFLTIKGFDAVTLGIAETNEILLNSLYNTAIQSEIKQKEELKKAIEEATARKERKESEALTALLPMFEAMTTPEKYAKGGLIKKGLEIAYLIKRATEITATDPVTATDAKNFLIDAFSKSFWLEVVAKDGQKLSPTESAKHIAEATNIVIDKAIDLFALSTESEIIDRYTKAQKKLSEESANLKRAKGEYDRAEKNRLALLDKFTTATDATEKNKLSVLLQDATEKAQTAKEARDKAQIAKEARDKAEKAQTAATDPVTATA